MFDLFRRRDKAVRILLGALLLMVALSMLMYLVPGSGGASSNTRDEQVIAEIGSDIITLRDVQRQLQAMTRNRQLPPEMLAMYAPQMVEQMINDHAVAYEAAQLGYTVSDAELANTIQSIGNGQFSDHAAYERFVAEQGMTIPQFEENLRKIALQLRLQNVILQGVIVTGGEITHEFTQRNEKVKLEYIAFSPTELKSKVSSTPAELQDYFNKHRAMYMLSERRDLDMLVVDESKVAESIQLPDAQLLQAYNANLDGYRIPERVKVRHILLMTNGKTPAETAKIKTQSEDLLKQLKAGADFAELARRFSEDKVSAAKNGDLGWVTRGQTVKNFEDAAFSLKTGVLSNLITTEYGFHILQVQEKEDARLRPFAEVKNDIATQLKKQAVVDRMTAIGDAIHADLSKAPYSAAAAAQKYNVRLVHVDKTPPGDPLPEVGADKPSVAALSALKSGEVSAVLPIGSSKLIVAVSTALIPPHQAEFNDVAAKVRDQFVQEKAAQLATEASAKAAVLLKSNGGDLNAAAKAVGLSVKTTDSFSRRGAAEGIGSAMYLADVFEKPVGSIVGPVSVPGQTILAKVIEKVPADMSKLPTEREAIMTQLKSKKSQERNQLFQDSIVTKLTRDGKIKIHKDVMQRLSASYAG